MGNLEHALSAYEHALRHNSHSLPGLTQVAGIARIKENYPKASVRSNPIRALHVLRLTSSVTLSIARSLSALDAHADARLLQAVEYFQAALQVQGDNGEVWSALGASHACLLPQLLAHSHAGHCYLMQDDLQKAYSAYQQALYLLPNPKEDPKLWYGIGILYDRYGSLNHAEEAFASVLQIDKG